LPAVLAAPGRRFHPHRRRSPDRGRRHPHGLVDVLLPEEGLAGDPRPGLGAVLAAGPAWGLADGFLQRILHSPEGAGTIEAGKLWVITGRSVPPASLTSPT